MIRLSQTEAVALFQIQQDGVPIIARGHAEMIRRMVKRGLITESGSKYAITAEGRAAYKRWAGTDLA